MFTYLYGLQDGGDVHISQGIRGVVGELLGLIDSLSYVPDGDGLLVNGFILDNRKYR